jgi:hypothetical protein
VLAATASSAPATAAAAAAAAASSSTAAGTGCLLACKVAKLIASSTGSAGCCFPAATQEIFHPTLSPCLFQSHAGVLQASQSKLHGWHYALLPSCMH